MTKLALTSLILLALIGASSAEAASLKADSTVILSGTSSLLAPLPAPVSYSAGGPNAVDQTGRSWPSSRNPTASAATTTTAPKREPSGGRANA
jgi:hypothetical protein